MAISCSRALRNFTWIVFTLVTLMSLSSRSRVHATVVCDDCRPLSLQEAPGVGLSLAPGYGSASIRFANGTVSDVAIVHGTEAYLRAMKRWQNFGTVPITPEDKHDARIRIFETSTRLSLLQRLRSWCQRGLRKPVELFSEPLYDELIPIAEMMRMLYYYANESVPLTNNKVFLAVPDFGNITSHEITRPIRPLLQLAGLDGIRYQRQSQLSLLHLYKLENCFGIWLDLVTEVPDEKCEKYRGRRIQSVFSIHLDGSSLNLRSMIRDDGMFPHDLGSVQLLWADEDVRQDNITYWDWLDRALHEFLRGHDIVFDLLLLSGTQATAPNFQQIIRDILKDNEKIVSRDYLRGADDHIFAAARGAAELARVGMCTDYNACVPNSWCQISEHCKEWAWHWDDEGARKTEL